MIILGILFLAAAAVAAVEVVLANDGQISLHMWRWTWQLDAFWLVVGGAAILAVAFLGLAMLKGGGGRARRLRRERRELAKENRRLAERAEIAESAAAADDETDDVAAPAAGRDEVAPQHAAQSAPVEYSEPAHQAEATEPAARRG